MIVDLGAVQLPSGGYKLVGDARGSFWWTCGQVRFDIGELDGYVPAVRQLPPAAPLPRGGGRHDARPGSDRGVT